MIPSPHLKYQQQSVQTASPSQLVIMLYDGAIRFLKLGIAGIEEKDYAKANTNLQKVQNIVCELMASLDHQYPIAKDLEAIYHYLLRLLIQANIHKEVKPAQEVLNHLSELRDAWVQAAKNVQQSGVALKDV